jgi:SHS2 domain-containing protein
LIYYKDAEQLLLRVRRVRFAQSCDSCVLEADTEGERLDPERHPQRVDVKAVTLHQFRLERTETGWSAFVILDI